MKRIFALLLVLSSLAAQAEESAWQKSYRLEAAARYAEAFSALDGVEDGADGGFALSRRGWLAHLQGKYGEAISLYQHALERNPKSLDARLGITLPLLARQRWREAAMYARQVITESAWNYTAHVRLLAAEEGQHEWRAMAEHAQRLVERYPSDATAWVYLARAGLAGGCPRSRESVWKGAGALSRPLGSSTLSRRQPVMTAALSCGPSSEDARLDRLGRGILCGLSVVHLLVGVDEC